MSEWYQPPQVLTNKNRSVLFGWMIVALACCLGIAGCTPPGPRALLDGKRLMEEGRLDEAIPRLHTATELLPTNALVWTYLGLAYHQNGQFEQAFKAYQSALKLDREMVAIRFNLGCLYLDMNNLNLAMDELRTFTLLQPAVPEGWIKLGTAQYRARRFDDAEKSFKSALSVQPDLPEALNGQGMVQLQRRRWQEAAGLFSAAMSHDTNYAPAILNAAIVHQQYLGRPATALQLYQRYLAVNPASGEEVRLAVARLEQQLNPAPVKQESAVATAQAPTAIKTSEAIPPVSPGRTARPETARAASTNSTVAPPASVSAAVTPRGSKPLELVPVTRPAAPTRTAEVVKVAAPSNMVARAPEPVPSKSPELQVSKVREDLVVRPPQDIARPASPGVSKVDTTPVETRLPAESTPPPPKKGFFSRLNPFSRSSRSNTVAEASNGTGDAVDSRDVVRPDSLPELAPPPGIRYAYRSPARPSDGNRAEAIEAFKRGIKAQRTGDHTRAAAEYQTAIRVDPGMFDAYYNLGLVALNSGDARLSLWAYEYALAIQPGSADARYNLALALKAGGYPVDSADQLEHILKDNPDDVRAHLSLGNLFAQQLKQPGKARDHYLKVLESSPKHPEASTIRFWLAANP